MKKGIILFLFFVFALDASAIFVIGKYTGNGGASQSISGLGFQPEVLLVKGAAGDHGWIATSTMPVGRAQTLAGMGGTLLTGRINSFDADGFTVGNFSDANTNGVIYYYTAWDDADGTVNVGSFTPNECAAAWAAGVANNTNDVVSYSGINYRRTGAWIDNANPANHPDNTAGWTSLGACAAFNTNIATGLVGVSAEMVWVIGEGSTANFWEISPPQFTINGPNSSNPAHFTSGSTLGASYQIINDISGSGFTIKPVNTSKAVHLGPANFVRYNYVIFRNAGNVETSTYPASPGGGGAKSVVALPPQFLIVKNMAGSDNPWFKTCEMPATTSYQFTGGANTTVIDGFNATGFHVGVQGEVNEVGSGETYEYFSMNGGTCGAAVPCNSVGGTVSSSATVCSGANTGTITLAGHNGSIVKWQSSIDNWVTPVDIANVTTSLTYTNLVATTKYRVVVKDGACAAVNSADVTITIDPVSVGGTVTADATVCSGANGATLTLAGHTGSVTSWEYSTDNFVTKTTIANITASQAYLNLTATTKYRAVVKSGTCVSANSAAATITVNPVSVGGMVTADATVCSGANGATLTLAGNTGSITGWERSTDNFVTTTAIANITTSQAYLNLTTTTKYRAIVKSGVCPSANSSAATITVDPVSVGGAVTADATVCSGANGATLNLAGQTGTITGWERSTDNFVTKTAIANLTASQAYLNLTTTTKYRAVVKSGVCPSANSAAATITVDPVSVGGTVTADATVCSGSNGATLTLAGQTGSVTGWERSTDNFVTTTAIANVTTSQAYLNLIATTKYRAVVKSGTCASANSAAATITVDPVSVGGTVTADATVCSGANGATLNLAGQTGSITGWESSTDNFSTTTSIANLTASQAYLNLTTTTKYRAVVKSGVCPSANSVAATITVDPVSVGGTVTADATVCSGSNAGTLTLAGQTGTITSWESSEDNFVSTTPIINNTASQNYNNLTATTKYRAVVTSGVCPSDNSAAATITVDVVTVGGTVTNDTTVCSGANAGILNLAGYTGSITGWEMSEDNFTTIVPLPDVTPSLAYNNVILSRKYRAVIKSGVCPSDNSSAATITVDSVTVGGTVTSDTAVCSGANFGILRLSGNVGTIKSWQSSTDNFVSSTPIAHTSDTLSYTNLTVTTKYRAVVKSGVCPSKTSARATVTIDPVSVGGNLTADATVCSGSNSGTLNLNGNTGNISGWESSINNFATSTTIPNLTSSYTFSGLTSTTKYRALVKSGTCPEDTSSVVTITVDPVSVGGSVTASTTVCSGSNAGILALAGHTGTITGWESSEDNFSTKTAIANTNDSLAYTNITKTKKYRAVIKSGICSSTASASATITVDEVSVGGAVTADATVCSGSNSGQVALAGQVGTIMGWAYSTDGFVTDINPLSNTSSVEYFNGLTKTTQYRAIVKSGVCAPALSSAATITVDPVSVGGTVTSDALVCLGVNSGTLNLAGYTGTITGWESSTDDFNNSTPINNTTASQTYNNISVTTKFRVIITSGVCSPVNSTSATLTIDPITVQIDNKTICEGSTTSFDAGAGYSTYTWTGLGTGIAQTTPAVIEGNYIITVTDALGCVATDDADLFINAFPMPNMGADTSMCSGQSVVLNPTTAANLNYVWAPNSQTTSTISVEATGQYSVTVSDNIGCSRKDTIFVQVHDLPVATLGNDTTMCDNGYDRLTLHLAYTGTKQLTWNTLDKNVDSIIIGETGTYSVEVVDSNQCSIKETIVVSKLCPDYIFEWPDVITPNGDGFNDEFQPKNLDDANFQQVIANMQKINFVVYDRWGVKVFQSEKVIPRWDGKFNGSDIPAGTYYWVVFYTNTAGKSHEDSGYFTLMR